MEIISEARTASQCVAIFGRDLGRLFPEPYLLLLLTSGSLKVGFSMKNRTETLEVGSLASGFSLEAANREGRFTLIDLLVRDMLVLEFLRIDRAANGVAESATSIVAITNSTVRRSMRL